MDNSTALAPAASYADFLSSKGPRAESAGFEPGPLNPKLYPFQQAIVAWALKRGRAAIFADCGMGKGPMQIEWARQVQAFASTIETSPEHTSREVPGRVLMVAPIAVGAQLIEEGRKFGVTIERAESPTDAPIQITNYERLHLFIDAARAGHYSGIALDESSILKSFDGKTRSLLIKEFSVIPYRLCCTATPALNDVSELANHAEFLGAMSRVEMLATFFVHDSDDGEWRLKGHAAGDMWRWMANWAVFVRRPSDLGYPDDGWKLPPLSITDDVVQTGLTLDLGGIGGRTKARKATLEARVRRAAEIILEGRWTTSDGSANGSRTASGTSATAPNASSETASGAKPTSNASPSTSASSVLARLLKSGAQHGDSSSTGSLPTNSSSLSQSSAAGAPSAAAFPGSGTSTTTTEPGPSEASSAAPATGGSGSSSTTPSSSSQLRSTCCAPRGRQWLVWCGLNDEESALAKVLGDDCAIVNGQTPEEERVEIERAFREGRVRVLITKPKVFGWGLNWQHCHHELFLGIGDSFEAYYQAIRRCWRFGQTQPVDVRIVTSDVEGSIADNVRRKEAEANNMAESIVAAVRDHQNAVRTEREDVYTPRTEQTDDWVMMLGDCVERIREVPTGSVGLTVYSPPFASLYTYSSSRRDLGNCKDFDEFFAHYRFLIPELLRVTMPGRRLAVHCQQLSTSKVTHGVIGWRDFRGELIKAHVEAGWIYDGEICIDKNPQAQAIRTKSKQLMFVQKAKDSSWLRPAMADYVLLFRHPDESSPVPVKTDVTNEEWILFAHPIWYGIRESNVLKSYRDAREDDDEKHICPLQLETIERAIRLWSNPGDVILSPFAGIGSEGYVARRFGRSFVGIELKESYFSQAVENIRRADAEGIQQPTEAAGLADIVAKQEAKQAKSTRAAAGAEVSP